MSLKIEAEIKEIDGKLNAVRDRTHKCFEEAGKDLDFSQVKIYGNGLSTTAVAEKVRADDAEMNDLAKQVETLKAALKVYDHQQKPSKSIPHPGPADAPGVQTELKTLGQRIVEHDTYKGWQGQKGAQKFGSMELDGFGLHEIKTLFQTTAGWAPESIRSGRVVDAVTRPIQILDIIPTGTMNSASYPWMLETTRTHAAAETAEGATYKESTFELTEQTSTARKITDSIPVTDEQLEDEAAVQSYLDMRVRFGISQRLDNQVLNGDGTPPNLTGIRNTAGIQTQAKSADPVPDAFFKAMTKIRVTGRAIPTANIMHPNNWQGIRLLRTADGIYIWGNPSEAGPERLWGLPVVQSDAIPEGTGLVGSFSDWCQILERRGIIVEMGFIGNQFTEGKQTIRASMRAVFAVYRAPAFCTVTGL